MPMHFIRPVILKIFSQHYHESFTAWRLRNYIIEATRMNADQMQRLRPENINRTLVLMCRQGLIDRTAHGYYGRRGLARVALDERGLAPARTRRQLAIERAQLRLAEKRRLAEAKATARAARKAQRADIKRALEETRAEVSRICGEEIPKPRLCPHGVELGDDYCPLEHEQTAQSVDEYDIY